MGHGKGGGGGVSRGSRAAYVIDKKAESMFVTRAESVTIKPVQLTLFTVFIQHIQSVSSPFIPRQICTDGTVAVATDDC